ncbi:MAG: transposase family protein, partial [Spirochaetaceae bacterium]|nr:transposase family protein [Spirochaetaceae bacterium]
MDTVHHCGQATQGQYVHALTATDVASGWIELRSLLNNAHTWTFEALSNIKNTSLLPIREFHSDNGSEFINNATEIWCKSFELEQRKRCFMRRPPRSGCRMPRSAYRMPRSAYRMPRSAYRMPHSAYRMPRSAY